MLRLWLDTHKEGCGEFVYIDVDLLDRKAKFWDVNGEKVRDAWLDDLILYEVLELYKKCGNGISIGFFGE